MSSFFSSISSAFTTLTADGLPPTAAASAVHALFGGGTAATVKAYLVTIMGNYTNATLVADQVMKIEEVSGLPATVANPVGQLVAAAAKAASDPTTGLPMLNSLVSLIEAELG